MAELPTGEIGIPSVLDVSKNKGKGRLVGRIADGKEVTGVTVPLETISVVGVYADHTSSGGTIEDLKSVE